MSRLRSIHTAPYLAPALHSKTVIHVARREVGPARRYGSDVCRRGALSCVELTVVQDGAIEIVVADLALDPAGVRACASVLSDAERERASRFAFFRDARRFIVARVRLRQLLATRLGVRPESVELAYGPCGKPALAHPGRDRDLRFNLSRRDDIAVYALSFDREVGIDLEAVRVIRDADSIAARWFSQGENDAYRALDRREQPLGFVNCWTRKEAFVKALGDGLCYGLDRFEVSLTPGEPAKLLRVEHTPGGACGWSLDSFSPVAGYVAAVAARQ